MAAGVDIPCLQPGLTAETRSSARAVHWLTDRYAERMRFGALARHAEEFDAKDAPFRVGCENPSHLSREHRRLFGAPPRRDTEKRPTPTA